MNCKVILPFLLNKANPAKQFVLWGNNFFSDDGHLILFIPEYLIANYQGLYYYNFYNKEVKLPGAAMKKYFIVVLVLLLCLVIGGCGLFGNHVSIEDFSPQGEVKKLTSFKVEFSENLAPPEMLNNWTSDEFIEFTPKIEGKFKWISPKTLIFSPEYPLQPIQSYRAKITNKVLFNTKFSPDFKEYEFHTPYFDVVKAEYFWVQLPNENYKLSIKANLYFNYPVNPSDLRDYLTVKNKGESLKDFQIVSESPSDVIALNLGQISQTDKEQQLELIVKKGLFSIVGKKSLQDEKTFSYELAPITRLAVTDVSSGYSDQKGWIEVYTTQRVDDKRIKEFVKVEPAKDIQYFVNENSFRIEGDFSLSQVQNLRIKKGLPGLYGGEMENDFEQEVTLADLDPSVRFTDSKGRYMMLSGNRNIELRAVNIPSVNIEVSQVFKNNILYFLSRYDYYNENEAAGSYYFTPYYEADNFGRPFYSETRLLKNRQNKLEKFNVNLDHAFNAKLKGLFIVNVSSTSDSWRRAGKIVSMSDLGIIAKMCEDELIVFVNSIAAAEPVENVEITLLSENNQTLLSGKTDQHGIIHFKNIANNTKDFKPRLITAETNGDFNYIDLPVTEIRTSRFDVGGASDFNRNYKVFLYGERDLYRPGDKVNISGIVRNETFNVIKGEPVITRIIAPTGKTYSQFKSDLNQEGSFEISFAVPPYIQTGQYRAEVLNGAGSMIGSYNFSVEEIVPDKIRLLVKADRTQAKPGETAHINLQAEYLFGAKASGLRYEASYRISHRAFSSRKYSSFDFSNSTYANTNIPSSATDGILDENGNATLNFKVPQDLNSSGIATLYSYLSVFDPTGRTVDRSTSIEVYPLDYYIGIKSPGYYFSTNEQITFKIAAVDKNDKTPSSSMPAIARLIRYDWQTVLKKDNSGRYYYASEKKDIQEWERNLDLSGGEKSLTLNVSKSGEYELRIFRKGSSFYSRSGFWAYGWGSSTVSSFAVDKEGKVEILTDKVTYSPNEKAKILFTAPFSGKMLVTLERNGIYDYHYLDVKDRSAQMEISLNENYMPNIYVTATLFKKHSSDNSTPFFVGHGFASLKVERRDYKLPVSIQAPQKIKPNTKQDIVIRTSAQKQVYVTLAAVDEGILQINDYKTPDPYSYMYEKQSLKVTSYDLYELLLPEIISLKSSSGGDQAAGEIKKRTNPITTKRFKLLSMWSGIKKTSSDGTVHINLDIPQFNGEVRLMAVAYSGQKFGSAEARMKVSDDIIIEPQLPRFLSTNDSLIMPVTLLNTTGVKGKVTLGLKVSGPLKILSQQKQNLTISPNASALASFVIKTGKDIGQAKVTLETSGFAKVKEETDIAIRPVSPYLSESSSGRIQAGKDLVLDIPQDFIESTKTSSVIISKFPSVRFSKQLRDLIGYPHGCVEQTVSRIFALLYFDDLARLVAQEYYKNSSPAYYVKEGIKKLESMQLFNGSLSYWPGSSEPSWWGSVYAAHFLIEAKKAGYDVSDNVLQKLLNFLAWKVKEKHVYNYETYVNNLRVVHQIANKEIIYSLYVLSLAGKSDISTMNYYKNRPNLVSSDCRYLLSGAYALAGKWNSYYEVVPALYKEEKTERQSGGSFDSDIRANAIMLNTLLDIEPSNKQIPFMVKYLSKQIKNAYSTQENAFAFLALGKAAKFSSNANLKIEIKADAKTVGRFTGGDLNLKLDSRVKKLLLKASGQGEVYYFQNNEGVKRSEVKEGNSNMKVSRTYYDYRSRNPISNGRFYQGQLIVCKISLQGFNIKAENIAITDLIPSGFEIENPRLPNAHKSEWKSTLNVKYMDVRDDRLILFTDLDGQTKDYYYFIRVVNKGKFQLPVISAEAMYDPGISSSNGRGSVLVGDYNYFL
ncbi:MAG: MG2 domain-containing protein [Bacteroidota bacterium]|nr:MG2 domain-containing protein [Bacteroidota bacterium]